MTAGGGGRSHRDRISLARHLARGGRYGAIPAALLLGTVLLVVASRFAAWGVGSATTMLRAAAVALAVGVVCSLDDAAAETLSVSPTTLLRRRATVLALAATGAASAWGLLVGLGSVLLPATESACLALVGGRLTLELGVLAAVAVAIGAAVARTHPTAAAVTAGPGLVLAFVAAQQAEGRWTLFPGGPLDVAWTAARAHLWLALAAAVVLALWWSRDPWARSVAATRRVAVALTVAVATAGAVGVATAGTAAVGTDAALESALREVVAAQRIDHLEVRVSHGGDVWTRTVVDGELRPAGPEELLEVGALDVAEVAAVIDGAGGPVAGNATPSELESWIRALPPPTDPDDDLGTRLASSAPPGIGTQWVPPRPGPSAPTHDAVSQVRHLPDSGAVVTVMTGTGLPACGVSVADALVARLR